jgi:hypothetical protein
LIIKEAKLLSPPPTVLFFYFSSTDPERKGFIPAARSLLSQFLRQDNSLLDYLYDKCCASGEAFLNHKNTILELLTFAFDNCSSAYIILDGLDECEQREERKAITQWFRRLIEELPPSKPDRLRCLFVSQDDGPARNDFAGIASIRITRKDIKDDLLEFSRFRAEEVQSLFHLTDQKTRDMIEFVVQSVGGRF